MVAVKLQEAQNFKQKLKVVSKAERPGGLLKSNFKLDANGKNGNLSSSQDNIVDYYVQPKPVFVPNSKSLYVPSGCNINVYNNIGGELLDILRKHKYRIVGMCKDPSSQNEIITCDEKANICYWNSPQDELFKLNFPDVLNPTVTYFGFGRDSYLVGFQQDGATSLFEYPKSQIFKQKSPNFYKPRHVVSNVLLGQTAISTSCEGLYLVAAKENNLYVTEFPYNRNPSKTRCHRTQRTLTCALCHPERDLVAVGDNIGSVMLWYNIMEMRPVKVDLHWHTLPIADITFSSLGNVLYSGGGECVIVKWNLAQDSSRSFLPRLGVPVRYIVEDEVNSSIAAVHVDNAISIINAREMKLEGLIQTLTAHLPTPDCERPLPVGLLVHPKTQDIIKNGRTGHLQCFNPHSVKMLFNLDVTLCNFVTEERNQKLPNADVVKAAISDDGSWLATNEVCHLTPSTFESILKFWQFSSQNQRWELNTSIQQPHSDKINCISFKPNPTLSEDSICCTCSQDGTFKIWKLIQYLDVHGKTKCHWNNREARDFRELPATSCTFSQDSSLLAVAFGSVVTMWTMDNYSYLGSLSQPFLMERIIDLTFNYGDKEGTLLVVRSENWLCTWDILSCSLVWRKEIPTSCFAVDYSSGVMGVFTKNKEVFIYNPQESKHLTSLTNVSNYQVIAAAFVPNRNKDALRQDVPWDSSNVLYFFDESQSFFSIQSNDEHSSPVSDAQILSSLRNNSEEERTMFSSLVGATRNVTQINKKESPNPPISQIASSKSLMEQLIRRSILTITFSELIGHLDAFLPDISKPDEESVKKENSLSYNTIEETTPETPVSNVASKLEESKNLKLIQNLDFNKIVKSLTCGK